MVCSALSCLGSCRTAANILPTAQGTGKDSVESQSCFNWPTLPAIIAIVAAIFAFSHSLMIKNYYLTALHATAIPCAFFLLYVSREFRNLKTFETNNIEHGVQVKNLKSEVARVQDVNAQLQQRNNELGGALAEAQNLVRGFKTVMSTQVQSMQGHIETCTEIDREHKMIVEDQKKSMGEHLTSFQQKLEELGPLSSLVTELSQFVKLVNTDEQTKVLEEQRSLLTQLKEEENERKMNIARQEGITEALEQHIVAQREVIKEQKAQLKRLGRQVGTMGKHNKEMEGHAKIIQQALLNSPSNKDTVTSTPQKSLPGPSPKSTFTFASTNTPKKSSTDPSPKSAFTSTSTSTPKKLPSTSPLTKSNEPKSMSTSTPQKIQTGPSPKSNEQPKSSTPTPKESAIPVPA